MARRTSKHPIATITGRVVFAALVASLVLAAVSVSAMTIRTDTGLDVTIHTAAEIRDQWLVEIDGRTWLRHPVAGDVELDTVEHPWTDLVPMDAGVVAAAMTAVHGFHTDLDVEIFLLPGFPAEVLSSFARRESIFLAPAFAAPAPETVAYVTIHELGHVLCWAAVDPSADRWAAYREARGLDVQLDPGAVPHAERHREIIAEDFRSLFGGSLATASGTIENADLTMPDAVAGLRDLLVSFLATPADRPVGPAPSRVYPNPCREQALVELDLPGGTGDKAAAAVTILEIYDVRGRLVRRLDTGRTTGDRATVTWDGAGSDGRRAPAGVYAYRIQHGTHQGVGQIVLLAR